MTSWSREPPTSSRGQKGNGCGGRGGDWPQGRGSRASVPRHPRCTVCPQRWLAPGSPPAGLGAGRGHLAWPARDAPAPRPGKAWGPRAPSPSPVTAGPRADPLSLPPAQPQAGNKHGHPAGASAGRRRRSPFGTLSPPMAPTAATPGAEDLDFWGRDGGWCKRRTEEW